MKKYAKQRFIENAKNGGYRKKRTIEQMVLDMDAWKCAELYQFGNLGMMDVDVKDFFTYISEGRTINQALAHTMCGMRP
jgi:hypothetical protein